MKKLVLLLLAVACGDSSTGLSTTGANFSITNRSSSPATVVLHQNTWDANSQTWTELPAIAYQITVQPSVCTDTTLNLEAVSATVATATDTVSLDVFGLYETNTWTATVVIGTDASVSRAARQRGQGCA